MVLSQFAGCLARCAGWKCCNAGSAKIQTVPRFKLLYLKNEHGKNIILSLCGVKRGPDCEPKRGTTKKNWLRWVSPRRWFCLGVRASQFLQILSVDDKVQQSVDSSTVQYSRVEVLQRCEKARRGGDIFRGLCFYSSGNSLRQRRTRFVRSVLQWEKVLTGLEGPTISQYYNRFCCLGCIVLSRHAKLMWYSTVFVHHSRQWQAGGLDRAWRPIFAVLTHGLLPAVW